MAVTDAAEPAPIGEAYRDADDAEYPPLLVQPLLVFEASADQLQRAAGPGGEPRRDARDYTAEMFATGNDDENRAAVRAVRTEALDLVGLHSGRATATPTPCFAAFDVILERG